MHLDSRDGTVLRVLTSYECCLTSILTSCHMWVEFVVFSCLALRVFVQVLQFSSLALTKATSRNSDSTRIEELYENQLRLMWLCL